MTITNEFLKMVNSKLNLDKVTLIKMEHKGLSTDGQFSLSEEILEYILLKDDYNQDILNIYQANEEDIITIKVDQSDDDIDLIDLLSDEIKENYELFIDFESERILLVNNNNIELVLDKKDIQDLYFKQTNNIETEIIFYSKQQGYKHFNNPGEVDEFLCNQGIFRDDSTDVYFTKQLEVNNIDVEEFYKWEEKNNYDKERDFFIEEKNIRDLTEDEYFEAIEEELFSLSNKYELKIKNILPDDVLKLLEEKEECIIDIEDIKDELAEPRQFSTKLDMINYIKKEVEEQKKYFE